mmetsp:Transcript_15108/g.26319  ORF Transcript_15108/g.26319 Transcript_15108/m.26319 type:complete len:231 (-) Transcript_15108:157-849(-)
MASRMLPQHERVLVETYGSRVHDLVSKAVFQDAILVNTRLVSKRIRAHNRLVRLYQHTRQVRNHARGLVDLLMVDIREQVILGSAKHAIIVALSDVHGHYQLLQRSIACTLPNPVNRALDLTNAILDCGQKVGDRHTEIIMPVHRDDDILNTFHVLPEITDELAHFVRRDEPNGIRDVQSRCACLNSALVHLEKKLRIRSGCIFGGKLDIVAERTGIADHFCGKRQHFFS